MWNKVASNKYLDKLSKQEAYRKHISSLYNVKSSIDNRPPKEFTFLNTRPKAMQQKIQQQQTIQNSNRLLVSQMKKNMSSIQMMKKNIPSTIYIKDSLIATVNKKKQRQVQEQNRFLVQRIKSAKSKYSKNEIQKTSHLFQGYKTNMAYSKMDPYYQLQESLNQKKSKRRPATAKR